MKTTTKFVPSTNPQLEDDIYTVFGDGKEIGYVQVSGRAFIPAREDEDGIEYFDTKRSLSAAVQVLAKYAAQ